MEVAAMKSVLTQRIRELTAIDGVAGFEQKVVDYMAEAFRSLGFPTEVDRFGNLIATRVGTGGGPSVMVAAHSDEIGAMVKSVDRHGFLRFDKVGGTQDPLLLGRMVRVNGVFGVVGVKAGHLQKAGFEPPSSRDMYVDVGARTPAEVEALGIHIGDPIAYVSELHPFSNPDLLCGKAIDNRVSCAMLLQLFEELRGVELPGTVYGVVNSQEEVGWRGAQIAGKRLNPDAAIVVDTIPAGDTPDTDRERELNVGIGEGPVIALLSGGFPNGYIMTPAMKDLMLRLAREEGIPHQPALFPGSGSDAIMLHMVGEGIPTAVVNIPRRYAHSPIEVMDLNDAVNGLRLLKSTTVALATETVGWS
jgi:putative aminopeptidase